MQPLIAKTPVELIAEAERLSAMLCGKKVEKVWRHRAHEIGIEFSDGTRLFVDARDMGLEISVTHKK